MKTVVFLGVLACVINWGRAVPILAPAGSTTQIDSQRATLTCKHGHLRGDHALVVADFFDSATSAIVGQVSGDCTGTIIRTTSPLAGPPTCSAGIVRCNGRPPVALSWQCARKP